MLLLGIFLIIAAFALVAHGYYGAAVFWIAVASVLIARYFSKQKQTQNQQQTVIVNNYITQAPEVKQDDDLHKPEV